MSEQTPTTQEEKKPLSPEIMLTTLRKYQALCAHRAAEDAEFLDFLEQECGKKPTDADKQRACIAEVQQEAAVFEQAIAMLSVLGHPGFATLAHREALSSGRGAWVWRIAIDLTPGTCGGHRFIGDPDRFAALLKAHAALKPQEGAVPGKEG